MKGLGDCGQIGLFGRLILEDGYKAMAADEDYNGIDNETRRNPVSQF